MRFAWTSFLFARILLAASVAMPSPGSVLAVTESGVPAYAEAMEGLTAALGRAGVRVVDLRAPGGLEDLAKVLEAADTKVVVAVGSRALAEVEARHPAAPVLATMMLHGAAAADDVAGYLTVDLPLAAQLAAVRLVLPGALRVGVIRNPARARYSAEAMESQGRKEGFSLVVADCDGPARLLKAVASLKGRADLLLCLPDPDLYNSATIPPLVLAAIEHRLPIVGFSPAFVRAGAVVGVYPDYRALGRQAAEMAVRVKRGEAAGEESPAKVQLAVNQRMVRLLGLDLCLPPGAEVFR